MVCAEDSITFLSSKKKIEFLRKVENQKTEETGVPQVKLLVRDRVSNNNNNNNILNNNINTDRNGNRLLMIMCKGNEISCEKNFNILKQRR